MKQFDFKKNYRELYTAKSKPKLVNVPKLKFITFEGKGNPNTSKDFAKGIEALYAVVYNLKFAIKQGKTKFEPFEFKVMPMEGQWWSEEMKDFLEGNKDKWNWKIMILVPDEIDEEVFKQIQEVAFKKKGNDFINMLKLEWIEDGNSAQIMHTGSYDSETENIKLLHKFITDNKFKLSGLHREIYLSDARRVDPSKLKTIIRQPYV